jgi:hypothetical protein
MTIRQNIGRVEGRSPPRGTKRANRKPPVWKAHRRQTASAGACVQQQLPDRRSRQPIAARSKHASRIGLYTTTRIAVKISTVMRHWRSPAMIIGIRVVTCSNQGGLVMDADLWTTAASVFLAALAVFVALFPPPVAEAPRNPYLGSAPPRRWFKPTIIGLVVVALAFAAVGFSKRPALPMLVAFSSPSSDTKPIAPKRTVELVGTLQNLPKGHELWIVSKPFETKSFYYVVAGKLATNFDGNWNLKDENVGDNSDLGKGFYYYPVDANKECSKALSNLPSPRRLFTNPDENDTSQQATPWPKSCVLHRESNTIIRFKAK